MEIIKAKNISKSYKNRLFSSTDSVLKNLNLTIKPGEAFGLLGRNGAGKTTFIRIILGLLSFEGGSCKVFGENPKNPVKNSRIGYLPERFNSFGFLKGHQFLKDMGNIDSLSSNTKVSELIHLLNFESYVDKRISKYSKGTKQKLLLIHAFCNDPDLLILDEPTDGLDPMAKDAVRKILKNTKKNGKTILINSHLLGEVEMICDKVGILDQGSISKTYDINDLKKKEVLHQITIASDESIPENNLFLTVGSNEAYHYLNVSTESINEALRILDQNNISIISIEKKQFDLEKEVIKYLN
ncbi:ABC transporter ATP-binding protein [Fodinibius halophilus]|uniref:ABC transporter ATP-binding protein n=1 Tax=Fodinibius halophilus TaxID=1736908 RepID=A0A6M1TG60_9BACT|nr:ABC transporter ATP-binding protein [Fodinibius halophilus]NGP87630.1 ABC transporter ATP-binding protein [Fodinibius halophilus]